MAEDEDKNTLLKNCTSHLKLTGHTEPYQLLGQLGISPPPKEAVCQIVLHVNSDKIIFSRKEQSMGPSS